MNVLEQPNKTLILEQLARILSFRDFSASKILSDFLKFAVEETLEGRPTNLKEYTIAVEVLGRKKDFDPKLDPIVRIHAGRLRRALNNYYHQSGAGDPVRISIPKGAYSPVFTKTDSSLPSLTTQYTPTNGFPSKPVIAVLPFLNLSGDPGQDFFAEGFSVRLSVELGRFPELDVIGFPSSHHLAKTMPDDRSIGTALKADYLVTGSVQRTQDRIRIQTQLNRTETGVQLWAEKYDRQLNALQFFEVEDEVVHYITSIIGGHYGVVIRDLARRSQPPQGAGMETYDAVLWYNYYQLTHTEESYLQSRAALERAVNIAPDYSHAWAVLGELYMSALVMGFPPVENQLAKGMEYAHKAIGLNPKEQAGYQALAFGNVLLKRRDAVLEAAEACLAINPHATIALGAIAFSYACAGIYPRAMELFAEVTRLNPYYPWWVNAVPYFCLYHEKAYEEALKYAQKMNKPDTYWYPLVQAAALGRLEKPDDCRKVLDTLRPLDPDISRNARKYLSVLLIPQDLIEQLLEGLRMAGLEIV